MSVVVDTNVLVVANGECIHASAKCIATSCRRLLQVRDEHEILVLDDRFRIISEYRRNCRESGQPGLGDAFLKWVLKNWGNPDRCHCVAITPLSGDGCSFREFPEGPGLAAFDLSDRKFVAVALAHPERPPITVAADSDWWDHRDALTSCGVQVEFLCGRDPAAFT